MNRKGKGTIYGMSYYKKSKMIKNKIINAKKNQ